MIVLKYMLFVWYYCYVIRICIFLHRTLYCAKGNYEFGISRVIKSLDPYNKKLGTDTWFYAKRCFLSLIENMSKHMIMMRDAVIQECIQFLECCESKLVWLLTHDPCGCIALTLALCLLSNDSCLVLGTAAVGVTGLNSVQSANYFLLASVTDCNVCG